MQLLDDHLFLLYTEGKVNEEDAVDRSQNPGDMLDRIEGFKAGRIAAPIVPTSHRALTNDKIAVED